MWLGRSLAHATLEIVGALAIVHAVILQASQVRAQPSPAEAAIGTALKARLSGHYIQALKGFETAARLADQAGDIRNEARALMFVGGCQILTFQYRPALRTLNEAAELAARARDNTTGGAVAMSLGALYVQLGDPATAKRELAQAVQALEQSPHRDYLVQALYTLGQIQGEEGDTASASRSLVRGLSIAREARLTQQEATIHDQFGTSLLLAGKVTDAERELDAAYSIEIKTKDLDLLARTREHQAELELAKHNYPPALNLIDEAFSLPSASFKTSPQYYPINIRGKILFGLGRETEALASFRKAVDSATAWRQGALPGDVTATRTVVRLHNVYADYIDLAAARAIRTHDSVLMQQAFDVMAQHRAASLREQMALALERQGNLPPRYFELLSQLSAAQAQVTLGGTRDEDKAKLAAIRDQLAEYENKIGLEEKNNRPTSESHSDKKSLRDIRERLSGNEVLLSFWLGDSRSFLWTVTRDRVNLYELPRQTAIEQQTTAFSQAVERGNGIGSASRTLGRTLLGQLNSGERAKPEWLVVGDGALLNQVPFSALAAPWSEAIVAKHALRWLPSELLLATRRVANAQPRFIGLADPIYNAADSRLVRNIAFSPAKQHDNSIPLARLTGSAHEIRSAAIASGLPTTDLLLGSKATAEDLALALRSRPEILHIAVHIVSPPGKPGEASLALSLNGNNGMPDLLTAEQIATFRLPGTLVVLSGCSSEQGEVLPSAGLVGLSRAWLLAGAAAVIVSAWPTPDDSGQFFTSFYTHLRTSVSTDSSLARRASIALQEAQVDMQRGKGYRSSPKFWAAYSLISKE